MIQVNYLLEDTYIPSIKQTPAKELAHVEIHVTGIYFLFFNFIHFCVESKGKTSDNSKCADVVPGSILKIRSPIDNCSYFIVKRVCKK